MSRRPTPIADELESLATSLANSVRTHRLPTAPELQPIADRLAELGQKSAQLERFHAEMVSDAQEDELLRSHEHCTGRLSYPRA